MFWIEKWKNFVDQANISKVMLDLVWRDFVKFQWLGVHRRSEHHYLILCSDWLIGLCLLSFYLTPWFAWWFQANFAVKFSCGRLLMLLLDKWQMDKYCYIVRQWMFYNGYKQQTLLIKFAICLPFTFFWAHSRVIRTNVYILNTIAQKVFPKGFPAGRVISTLLLSF